MSEELVNTGLESRTKLISSHYLTHFFNFHLSVVGGSGSGKTVLTNHAFEVIPNTAVFFNVMGLRGIKGVEANTLKEFDSLLYQDTFKNQTHKIVISPKTSEDIEEYIERVIMLVKRIRKLQDHKYRFKIQRRVTMFFDEVQYLCENSDFLKQARNVSLMGRNKELFAVWISQRPQNINKNLFTQSNMLFGLIDEFDHAYLKNIRMDVPDCLQHEFYWWERMTGQEREFVKLDINQGAKQ